MWWARNGISRSLFVCLLPAYQSALASLQSQFDCRGQLKCAGTRAETRFRLSTKRTSLLKSAGASVQSTAGSQGVRISGSNVGYAMFWGSVKGTSYPLHSPVSPSLPLPCVTVCHHVSPGVYQVCGTTASRIFNFTCRVFYSPQKGPAISFR
jgi:hypothetical protein